MKRLSWTTAVSLLALAVLVNFYGWYKPMQEKNLRLYELQVYSELLTSLKRSEPGWRAEGQRAYWFATERGYSLEGWKNAVHTALTVERLRKSIGYYEI